MTKKKEKRTRLGKRTVVTRKKGKKSKKHCALCDRVLQGTQTIHAEKKLCKSKRRPSRVFGGSLCSECLSGTVLEAAKVREGIKELKDVQLKEQRYAEALLKRMK